MSEPFRFPGEADSPRTAARDRVDAAVLAYRADPSDYNHAVLLLAQADYHRAFLRDQTEGFQARTR